MSNNNELISIIVPVYNVQKYLDRCMNTLLNQTYKNIEIILIDDESPDSCPQMCDEYKRIDQRIKVVHKLNEGLGFARNSGLEIARGKYIIFVDSDDYVTENMCELLYQSAKKYDADVVYGGIFYADGKNIKESKAVTKERIWKGNKEVKSLLLDFIATKPQEKKDTIIEVSVWKALFRKKIFDDYNINFVSERQFISEDIIFDIDYLSKCNCVVAIPEPVYYYCVNPNSLSKVFRTDRFYKVKKLYKEIIRKLTPIYGIEVVNKRGDRFLIARARTNARQIVRHEKIIGKKEMISALHSICEDEDMKEIFRRYPIYLLPFKYKLVAYLMKYRCYHILKIVLGR